MMKIMIKISLLSSCYINKYQANIPAYMLILLDHYEIAAAGRG